MNRSAPAAGRGLRNGGPVWLKRFIQLLHAARSRQRAPASARFKYLNCNGRARERTQRSQEELQLVAPQLRAAPAPGALAVRVRAEFAFRVSFPVHVRRSVTPWMYMQPCFSPGLPEIGGASRCCIGSDYLLLFTACYRAALYVNLTRIISEAGLFLHVLGPELRAPVVVMLL
ncbi:hypothetical protein AOLI_G00129520 [Acnodon oligacanthus]